VGIVVGALQLTLTSYSSKVEMDDGYGGVNYAKEHFTNKEIVNLGY